MGIIVDIYEDLLCEKSSPLEVIGAYLDNSLHKDCVYDFGYVPIHKGTILHRVRKYDADIDWSDLKQWLPNPKLTQSRCNCQGQRALYLGSHEELCCVETGIAIGDKYVCADYEVTNDLKLGSYVRVGLDESFAKHCVGDLLNSALIAPVSQLAALEESNPSELTVRSFVEDIYKCEGAPYPIKFGEYMKGLNRIAHANGAKVSAYGYNVTNILSYVLARQYPQGICYSSSYIPCSNTFTDINYYNVCLYDSGIPAVRYADYHIAENHSKFAAKDIFEYMRTQWGKHNQFAVKNV